MAARQQLAALTFWLTAAMGPLALVGCGGTSAPSTPLVSPAVKPTIENVTPTKVEANPTTLNFTDVTASAGINFTYHNSHDQKVAGIVEMLGGGAGLIDFDRDGKLDLFLVGGGKYGEREVHGYPSVLYRGQGNWKFENVSAAAGGGFPGDTFKHGISGADYDNDGFTDLIVCAWGGFQFWRNMGDGTFERANASAHLEDKVWSSSSAWGDFNGDGFLDLFVAHYVDWSFDNHPVCPGPEPGQRETCPPKTFNGLPDSLFFSNGDGTFRDVSRTNGLLPTPEHKEPGKGLNVLVADFDGDGDQDVYVANDTVENFLYLNDGRGQFIESAMERGCAFNDLGTSDGSMGLDVGDFNLDGLPDIWVANYQEESFALYAGETPGFFNHLSKSLGITAALEARYVGFGAAFIDLNRDGYEDILQINGHVLYWPKSSTFLQEPVVMINEAGKRFSRLMPPPNSYLATRRCGRGLAVGDLDNDGDVDWAVVNHNEPATLIRNDSTDDGTWLRVRLIGRKSNRDAVGAKLVLQTSIGKLTRYVKGGGSYASQCDPRAWWGIPKSATVNNLTIIWPSGNTQVVATPARNTDLIVIEK